MEMNLLQTQIASVCVPNYFTRLPGTAQGEKRMIDDRNEPTGSIVEPELNLPPPRFDERASAEAQPVQRIPTNRVSTFQDIAVSLRRALTGKSRSFALVVIAGIATGTLGGMSLVKDRHVTDVPPSTNASVSELTHADSSDQEPRAEVFGMTDLPSGSLVTRIRKGSSRVRTGRGPRAYRVAVLH